METSESQTESARVGDRWWPWVLTGVLGYFALRVIIYALLLHAYVPPDEVDFYAKAEHFSHFLWVPGDSVATASHMITTGYANLYFWVMGKLMLLNVFGVDSLTFARLLQLPFALCAAWYAFLLSGRFITGMPGRILVVVVFTNTLQFSTLSGTVTYDNPTNCLAIMATYYIFELFTEVTWDRLLKFIVVLGLGSLCKINFPMYAVIFIVALVLGRGRRLPSDLRSLGATFRPTRVRLASLALTVVVVGMSANLYVGNLVRYGTFFVHPLDVLPLEMALMNRIVRRDWIVDQFKEGHLSYEQAIEETKKIDNVGNRGRARQLLAMARNPEALRRSLVPLDHYVFIWTQIMLDRAIGFQGNGSKVFPPERLFKYSVESLVLLGLALAIRRFSSAQDAFSLYSLGIVLACCVGLIIFVTYPLYTRYGAIDNAVNGRYLFPVLPLFLSVLVRHGIEPLSQRAQLASVGAIGFLFVLNDLPYFLTRIDHCWLKGAERLVECAY